MPSPKQLSLFDAQPRVVDRGYLDSVILDASVAAAWAKVARHYITAGALVLDLTHRNGVMWQNCREHCRIVRCDIDPELRCIDVRSDWRFPPFKREVFDVLVWDPPWCIEPSRSDGARDGYAKRKYGARIEGIDGLFSVWQFAHWHDILKENGLLFVRCQTFHHAGEFNDLPHDVRRAAWPWFDIWDEVVHVCGGIVPRYPMDVSAPKTRKLHSYFLVFKKARECHETPQTSESAAGGNAQSREDADV